MTNTRLFWHLIKFHVLSFPLYLWLLMLGLVVLFGGVFSVLGGSTTLGSPFSIFSLSYLFIFGVQISWGIQTRATPNFNQNWTTGMHDFLRTRAVDRTILFWSKLTVHFAFCSFVWIALAAPQLLQQSPMQVRLYDNAEDQQLKAELLSVPAFQAKVVSDNGKGRVVIDVEKGARIMAGFTGVKVTLVTLLTLWFFAALRWSMRRMMIVILTFFAAWMLMIYGSIWSEISWIKDPSYPQLIVSYARHSLAIWIPTLVLGGLIIWQARRRYLRP